MSRGYRKAFTLIELLIVVAIIAILAAIAVPNFLEAQVRAKVSRAKNDMRSITVGIEALRVDQNALLVDFWGDDTAVGVNRIQNRFGIKTQGTNNRGGTMGVFVPLTTPVAYITSVPIDPFAKFASMYPGLIVEDWMEPHTYMYMCSDPIDGGWIDGFTTPRMVENEYILFSSGPDRVYEWPTFGYDATNGTNSRGDVIRSSVFMFDTPYVRQ